MKETIPFTELKNWLEPIKNQIRNSQIKASLSVNKEMISLYWYLGKKIIEKQAISKWGEGFLTTMSNELRKEFPHISGFSSDNLRFMKKLYLFYNQDDTIVAQVVQKLQIPTFIDSVAKSQKVDNPNVAQLVQEFEENKLFDLISSIPWGHHTLILRKIKGVEEALFYVSKTIENNWSRSILEYHIETNLFQRQGKAVTNFNISLPLFQSDLAIALLKDPYSFEFITLSEKAKEKELENKLVEHLSQFLLELGNGFAYLGRQFLLKIGRKEYRTDLLFYHTKLKCYIIIELKTKEFEPEHIGKLNFYISAINELLKEADDRPTIGILLCKEKDNFEVEFSLKDVNNPIGVSRFNYTQLPENIKSVFPDLQQLSNELRKIENE